MIQAQTTQLINTNKLKKFHWVPCRDFCHEMDLRTLSGARKRNYPG